MITAADVLEGASVERSGRFAQLAALPLSSVVIDSRQVTRGSLFVALPGEHVDGHDYVGHALGKGAAIAVVHHALNHDDYPDAQWMDLRTGVSADEALVSDEAHPIIVRVDDTLAALQRISAYWRARFAPRLRVVGITGSIGKTTTKELTAQVLSVRYNVLKNEGNLNNEIGVPLTLLRLRPEHEAAVVELGMYARGEIALFASLAQPQIGVVTMVAPAHLERLGTIENIALAKAELVEALPADGVAILNDDDARVRAMADVSKARVVTYGLTSRADFWADDIESYGLDGISFRAHEGEVSEFIRVPLLGRHSVHTALRAAVVGRVMDMAWEEILEGFLKPAPQLRLAVAEGPHGSLVLDDTYNASEESMLAALNLLDEIHDQSHIAVLGDMLELGDVEEQAHRTVGCRAGIVARYVVCVGKRARWIAEEAIACGAPAANVYYCDNNSQVIDILQNIIQEKCVILVKGSRGMQMEEIVAGLSALASDSHSHNAK